MMNLDQIKLQQVVQISSFPTKMEKCYFSAHLLGCLVKFCFVFFYAFEWYYEIIRSEIDVDGGDRK